MPGGQYTNLFQQAQALGLESRWPDVCSMYAEVNRLFERSYLQWSLQFDRGRHVVRCGTGFQLIQNPHSLLRV